MTASYRDNVEHIIAWHTNLKWLKERRRIKSRKRHACKYRCTFVEEALWNLNSACTMKSKSICPCFRSICFIYELLTLRVRNFHQWLLQEQDEKWNHETVFQTDYIIHKTSSFVFKDENDQNKNKFLLIFQ